MDADAPLILFDSGLGGLSVLAETRRVCPDLPVIYCADNAGLPYGTKTAGTVRNLVTGQTSSPDREPVRLCVSQACGDVAVDL